MKIIVKDPTLSIDTEAIVRFLVRYSVPSERIDHLHVTLQPSGWLRWLCRGYRFRHWVLVYTDASPKQLNRFLRHELGHFVEGNYGLWYTGLMMSLTHHRRSYLFLDEMDTKQVSFSFSTACHPDHCRMCDLQSWLRSSVQIPSG